MKSNETNDTPEQLLNKAYKCKRNELKEVLEKIEAKIQSEGKNETLSRAKSVLTTKMILSQENWLFIFLKLYFSLSNMQSKIKVESTSNSDSTHIFTMSFYYPFNYECAD